MNKVYLNIVVRNLLRDSIINENNELSHPFMFTLIAETLDCNFLRHLMWDRNNPLSETFFNYVELYYNVQYGNEFRYVIDEYKKGVNEKIIDSRVGFIPLNKKFI